MHTASAGPAGVSSFNAISRPSVTQSSTQNLHGGVPAHLDLRAPALPQVSGLNTAAFPSAINHRPLAIADDRAGVTGLGAGFERVRAPLPELVRHIQHEGLPVARLWENRSALLHIGLNQRGKPGLWLVQKIH